MPVRTDLLSLAPAKPPRRLLLAVIGFFFLTRILIAVVAFRAPQHRDRPEFPWWPDNPLIRWDAGHYRRILIRGYPPVIDDTTAFFPLYPVVTWPVWKAIVWADTAITGRPHDGPPEAPHNVWASEWALIAVTHVASLLAVIVFFRWSRELGGDAAALRACLLLCAFPAAMYFSVAYADGVFLLLLALMLLFSQRGRPWLAAICCGAATAARPTGIAAAVVLFFLTWRQWAGRSIALRAGVADPDRQNAGSRRPPGDSERPERQARSLTVAVRPRRDADSGQSVAPAGRRGQSVSERWLRPLLRLIPLGVVSICGLLLHEAYLWSYYGRPDAYFAAQKSWALPESFRTDWLKTLSLQPVLEPAIKPIKYAARGEFSKLTDARNWNRFINVVMVAAAICALFRPGPIPRPALWLTILVFLIAWSDDPFTGGRMLGITRYHLMGLPCFLWLAMRRPFAGRGGVSPGPPPRSAEVPSPGSTTSASLVPPPIQRTAGVPSPGSKLSASLALPPIQRTAEAPPSGSRFSGSTILSRVLFALLIAGMLLLQCFYIAGYVDWILVS